LTLVYSRARVSQLINDEPIAMTTVSGVVLTPDTTTVKSIPLLLIDYDYRSTLTPEPSSTQGRLEDIPTTCAYRASHPLFGLMPRHHQKESGYLKPEEIAQSVAGKLRGYCGAHHVSTTRRWSPSPEVNSVVVANVKVLASSIHISRYPSESSGDRAGNDSVAKFNSCSSRGQVSGTMFPKVKTGKKVNPSRTSSHPKGRSFRHSTTPMQYKRRHRSGATHSDRRNPLRRVCNAFSVRLCLSEPGNESFLLIEYYRDSRLVSLIEFPAAAINCGGGWVGSPLGSSLEVNLKLPSDVERVHVDAPWTLNGSCLGSYHKSFFLLRWTGGSIFVLPGTEACLRNKVVMQIWLPALQIASNS